MIDPISSAGSGMSVAQKWMDATANNIANINDVGPTSGPGFTGTTVIAAPITTGVNGTGQGVTATSAASGTPGVVAYDPSSPVADAAGNVRLPGIDLAAQMGDLILARASIQADAAVISRADEAYRSVLEMGRDAGAGH
jgi:flagellar basal-body rod protein FlgC